MSIEARSKLQVKCRLDLYLLISQRLVWSLLVEVEAEFCLYAVTNLLAWICFSGTSSFFCSHHVSIALGKLFMKRITAGVDDNIRKFHCGQTYRSSYILKVIFLENMVAVTWIHHSYLFGELYIRSKIRRRPMASQRNYLVLHLCIQGIW